MLPLLLKHATRISLGCINLGCNFYSLQLATAGALQTHHAGQGQFQQTPDGASTTVWVGRPSLLYCQRYKCITSQQQRGGGSMVGGRGHKRASQL
jgi:hypothetical protein